MSKKRIEINEETSGVRLRASRTGGVNLSTAPAKGITLNTKHGARVSKTYNGLTLGFKTWTTSLGEGGILAKPISTFQSQVFLCQTKIL